MTWKAPRIVEVAVGRWRRIPFTCTFLFGKRPPAYSVLLAFLAFGVFGTIGTGLIAASLSSARSWFTAMGILLAVYALLRWQRMQTWGRFELEFEDYLPDQFQSLELG